MHRFFTHILIAAGLFAFIFSPVKADTLDDVSNLIKAGNTAEISKKFATSVELKILSDEGIYSKAQAEAILKDFFKKHQPASVKIIHKLTSNPNYLFAVLILNTSDGNFRTSFSMKNIAGKSFITELSFEINKD